MSKRRSDEPPVKPASATPAEAEAEVEITAPALPYSVPLLHQRWRHGVQAALLVPLPIYLVFINLPDPGAGPSRPAAVPGYGFWVLVLACALGLLFGGRAVFRLVRSFLRAPGTIVIRDSELLLPPHLDAAAPVTVRPAELRHSYYLRRALPTTASGPVLVIESIQGVFQYPRDWFADEADQRRVALAVKRMLPGQP